MSTDRIILRRSIPSENFADTSGRNVLTAHLVLAKEVSDEEAVLQAASELLRDRYKITATTLQIVGCCRFHGHRVWV